MMELLNIFFQKSSYLNLVVNAAMPKRRAASWLGLNTENAIVKQ
ncbi:hypothetical protein [Aquirhabdus parva]|nr:hypothetical protein [Aquirhabdus parva]